MKRTLIQCLYRPCSSTITRKKSDNFHLESKGTPQLLREFTHLYCYYFLHYRDLKFKMSLPSRVITVTKLYESFLGVVLLSLFVLGLQNSRFNRVECIFSNLITCVNLRGGMISSAFTFRYKGVLQGHILFVAHLYIFLAVFWYFSHERLSVSWLFAW